MAKDNNTSSIAGLIFLIGLVMFSIKQCTSDDEAEKEENRIALEEMRAKYANEDENIPPIKEYSEAFANELQTIQSTWADGIVKDWKGDFIVSFEQIVVDTILFELSKNASKDFYTTVEMNKQDYEWMYYDYVSQRLDTSLINKIVIDFKPHRSIQQKNWKKADYIVYSGATLYTGNDIVKNEVGVITGKYIIDGEKKVLVVNTRGSEAYISQQDLYNNAYYYDADDLKLRNSSNEWVEIE